MNKYPDQILFYDGECGICNRAVSYVLKYEKSTQIYFTALQSNFAAEFFRIKKMQVQDMSTFYFYDNNKLFKRSKAAFRVAGFMRFPISVVKIFTILPLSLTDAVYKLIARNRSKINNKFCVIPNVEQKKRFLD